jgi:rRNA-processing protein FCF1
MSQMYANVNICEASQLSVNRITKSNLIVRKSVIDTNVIVSIIQDPVYAYNFKMNFGKDDKFVTTDKMWKEAEKITGIKTEIIKWTIKNQLGSIQTIKVTKKLESFAYAIQCKTNSHCHWPDSLLIVLGIWFDWIIVTHDHDLLKTCQYFHLDSMRPDSSGIKTGKRGKSN